MSVCLIKETDIVAEYRADDYRDTVALWAMEEWLDDTFQIARDSHGSIRVEIEIGSGFMWVSLYKRHENNRDAFAEFTYRLTDKLHTETRRMIFSV